jgi:hypothetical protein
MIDVSNMRIYELRDYARKIGVKSPTSKVKSELIEQIRLIESGEQKPHKTVKGRKPIMSFAIGDKNQQFLLGELEKLKKEINQSIDNIAKKISSRKI